jgi:hypothetical protein
MPLRLDLPEGTKVAKKSSKARRREASQERAPVDARSRTQGSTPPEAASAESGSRAATSAVEARGSAREQNQNQEPEAASPAASRPSSPPSPEALAAHDSFVRSPTRVVESLGIRVTAAVARRLASIPPPAPAADSAQDEL